jgi:hypothetical protein
LGKPDQFLTRTRAVEFSEQILEAFIVGVLRKDALDVLTALDTGLGTGEVAYSTVVSSLPETSRRSP